MPHFLSSFQTQILPVGFPIIGILHPFLLPNNSVLTFVSLVSSLLIKNFKISNLYLSYGETTQNVHTVLLTEHLLLSWEPNRLDKVNFLKREFLASGKACKIHLVERPA